MQRRLVHTWIAIVVACLAVLGSGTFIVARFVRTTFVECRGTLVRVPAGASNKHRQTTERDLERALDSETDLEIRYDERPGPTWSPSLTYSDVRVVWNRGDAACGCADIPVRENWDARSPRRLAIYRDRSSDLYFVRFASGGVDLAVFQKVDDRGVRFRAANMVDPGNISMLVFLLSLGALAMGASRAIRATPYATRMHGWIAATLRDDGLVEGETGAALGTLDARSRPPSREVIVDPRALQDHDVYRGLPILTRRVVGCGSHARWREGTMWRLNDARTLAILATSTTVIALATHVVFG